MIFTASDYRKEIEALDRQEAATVHLDPVARVVAVEAITERREQVQAFLSTCHCQAWDEGRVLVILETGHDPGPAHAQPDWIIPCHGVGQPVHDRNDRTKMEEP